MTSGKMKNRTEFFLKLIKEIKHKFKWEKLN
jgi:hypothetical protein